MDPNMTACQKKKNHSVINLCLSILYGLSQVQPTSQVTYGIEPKYIMYLSSSNKDIFRNRIST